MTQPPLIKNARLNILYYGVPNTISCNGQWWEFVDNGSKEIEWDKVEDGVFMSRRDVGKIWDAAIGWSTEAISTGVINKETTINNLFNH